MSSTVHSISLPTAVTSQQGVNSTTWTRPPLLGPLTVPELFAFHAEKSPDHPVIAFDDEHGNVQTLYHRDVFPAIRKAAKIVSGYMHPPEAGADGQVTVGILNAANSPLSLCRSAISSASECKCITA